MVSLEQGGCLGAAALGALLCTPGSPGRFYIKAYGRIGALGSNERLEEGGTERT